MPRTVVVLPVAGEVLPAAALPAMRAAERVYADATVPEKAAIAAGAVAGAPAGADWVLLTTDLTQAPEADEVIGAPRGAALLDAVAVMDRLRSPGGCPWDAEQDSQVATASTWSRRPTSCYEAIEDGDRAALREELGDVLLQVLFHARIATKDADHPFDIDEVAGDLVAKLVGRHPHVFEGLHDPAVHDTADLQQHRWEELERVEKQRESSVDGVATGQPAVALAGKLAQRVDAGRVPVDLFPEGRRHRRPRCSRSRRWRSWPARTRRRNCARWRGRSSGGRARRRTVRPRGRPHHPDRPMPTPGAPTGPRLQSARRPHLGATTRRVRRLRAVSGRVRSVGVCVPPRSCLSSSRSCWWAPVW